MKLSEYITKTLSELNGVNIPQSVEFDIAVMPFDDEIHVLRTDDANVSRIKFEVTVK